MNTSSLDNRLLSFFVVGVLALLGSVAFEAQRNGMTDAVSVAHKGAAPAVAATSAPSEQPLHLPQQRVAQAAGTIAR